MAAITDISEEVVGFDELEDVLGNLAGYWRETKSPAIAERYQILLNSLINMGWAGSLDLDDQLPRELMPPRYTELQLALREKRRAART